MFTMTTTVVFLSRHNADSKMIEQLQDKLGEFEFLQFKGTYSKFSGTPDAITFTEVVDKTTSTFVQSIPVNSFVVAVAPPQLQIELLNAIKFSGNKAILLQPLTNRVSGNDGKVTFEYCGLNQVHKVEITTSLFAGETVKPAEQRR
jgi:hypothetical protein